jgi:protein-tyrosine phosphatase
MKITFKNFRDMGGLVCKDGSCIKYGKIYRTPKLVPKNKADRNYLRSLNLDVVIDFRTEEEAEEAPDWLPAGVEYIHVPVFSIDMFPYLAVTWSATKATIHLKGEEISKLKESKFESYRMMPFSHNAYAALFNQMDEGKTLVFHCTQGKDRTGIAAMLIETAFMRDEKEIRKEFLKSNDARKKENKLIELFLKLIGKNKRLIEDITYCESVHEELLGTAYETILQKYDSIGAFLKQEYGITQERIEKWRKFYLE